MKLAVVGSRGFDKPEILNARLDALHKKEPITLIISGGAIGADTYADQWALANKIRTKIFFPDWKRYNNRAGFIRNQDIVNECDKLFAFWDGESKGTKHSIGLAIDQKKQIFVEMYKENATEPTNTESN